ncbi:MAG: hypothetical protein K6G45_02215 [Lachnospiraceae bacterium]|nr:hypothetical protein [Lachnospiraceae bacterium]
MNIKVLTEYLEAINKTIESKKMYFHNVFEIDTTDKRQDQVGKEVTERTLNTLKDLLMERVGYFAECSDLFRIFKGKNIIRFEEIERKIPDIAFDFRDIIEKNESLVQPIPIAVIVNNDKSKVLVIKKNKDAVSLNSPENNKELIYVGGHTRFEDKNNSMNEFLAICKTALKRERKEEIGISIAINEQKPFLLYTPYGKSKKHLAVCFIIQVDEESTKLRLDPHELVLKKGKSRSGRFIPVTEINTSALEDWSKHILQFSFGVDTFQNEQIELWV